MTEEWTDRELEGIALLLRELGIDPAEKADESHCVRCHEQVIFREPLGDFDVPEWRALGEKLGFLGYATQGRDYAWDVNYGRLLPILNRETVVIRMRREMAKELLKRLVFDSSESARKAGIVVEKALER